MSALCIAFSRMYSLALRFVSTLLFFSTLTVKVWGEEILFSPPRTLTFGFFFLSELIESARMTSRKRTI